MVPRVDVFTIRADEPLSRLVELLDTGHSRFPVRGAEGVDDVVGVVGIADILGVPPAERATTPVSAVAVPPLLVPATLPLPTVLDRLRAGHRQLACVVDEYGGFAGVITLEDLAEELVGPIRDEDDPPDRAPARQDDGSWVVPARWRIDEVADSTGIELPEAPEYDTVSGLVMRELGRVPEVGDRLEIALPVDGDAANEARALVEVLAVDRHVADSVRLRLAGAADAADSAGARGPADAAGTAGARGPADAAGTAGARGPGDAPRAVDAAHGRGPGGAAGRARGTEEAA
jgi:CBS domain containing-hemolysin-like protein